MATIYDVAKYLLDNVGPMSTWKLHKLCYYSQVWTLAWDSKELFPEEFEAWRNGPVNPDLFRQHKGVFMIDSDKLKVGDASALSPTQQENIDLIIRDYGDKDAYWLREQTHGEDPWKDVRGELSPYTHSNRVITKESMGLYYGGL